MVQLLLDHIVNTQFEHFLEASTRKHNTERNGGAIVNLSSLNGTWMMAMKFDKLKRIKQEHQDIVFGYIRAQIDHPIPDLIRSIILLFYYQSLESSILSDAECDKLFTMFDGQQKFKEFDQYSFELIYSSKRDGIIGDVHKIMTLTTQIFSMLPYIGRPGYHSNRLEQAHNLDFGVPYRLSPESM